MHWIVEPVTLTALPIAGHRVAMIVVKITLPAGRPESGRSLTWGSSVTTRQWKVSIMNLLNGLITRLRMNLRTDVSRHSSRIDNGMLWCQMVCRERRRIRGPACRLVTDARKFQYSGQQSRRPKALELPPGEGLRPACGPPKAANTHPAPRLLLERADRRGLHRLSGSRCRWLTSSTMIVARPERSKQRARPASCAQHDRVANSATSSDYHDAG